MLFSYITEYQIPFGNVISRYYTLQYRNDLCTETKKYKIVVSNKNSFGIGFQVSIERTCQLVVCYFHRNIMFRFSSDWIWMFLGIGEILAVRLAVKICYRCNFFRYRIQTIFRTKSSVNFLGMALTLVSIWRLLLHSNRLNCWKFSGKWKQIGIFTKN